MAGTRRRYALRGREQERRAWYQGVTVAALALVLACGSSGPSADPKAYVGEWVLEIGQSSCGQPFTVHFTIDPDDAAAASTEFINVVSDWWFAGNPSLTLLFSGSINWLRDDFDLRLHKSGTVQGIFSGSGSQPTRLSGTFSDPGGDFWVSASSGNCSASAVATKL